MKLQDKIKLLREMSGISQTELARRMGVNPPTICQYETGTRSPRLNMLPKLIKALGVSYELLLSNTEFENIEEDDNA